tara:strand:+ start:1425 stop:3074 length:1650 start_codon:yes stop_codon:yes gene_type:complete
MSFLDDVTKIIVEVPFVEKVYDFEEEELLIKGKVKITFTELPLPLVFDVQILKCYPLKNYDTESIKFKNLDLIEYKHVMGDGSICVHTAHHTNLKAKLNFDFQSLKNWIIKYYINKESDDQYEHIIVPENLVHDQYWCYQFTDIDQSFEKAEFGEAELIPLPIGIFKGNRISNNVIKSFIRKKDEKLDCQWSKRIKNLTSNSSGIFLFIESPPAYYGKFIYSKWSQLKEHLPQKFLIFLLELQKKFAKDRGKLIPLFLGYKIDDVNVHWQVAIVELGKLPVAGFQMQNGNWETLLNDEMEIDWGFTRNSSHKYFFGRGSFSEKITNKKILIIGVGAVGSMVAKTLTRCGCRFIDIADNDIKEPENVCRSEYQFNFGLVDKTEELGITLANISPFVETNILNKDYFQGIIKLFHKENGSKINFENSLNEYDIVFDCTTDNDLMHIFDSLNLKCDLINLSITNHAKELVGAFYPNTYGFVLNQFNYVLDNDITDLYNPTGCWSPTFKASYSDIALLVHMAMNHINGLYDSGKRKNNFVIKNSSSDLKLIEY